MILGICIFLNNVFRAFTFSAFLLNDLLLSSKFFICNRFELIKIGQLFSHVILYNGCNTTFLYNKFLFFTMASLVNNSFELPFSIIPFALLSNASLFNSIYFSHKWGCKRNLATWPFSFSKHAIGGPWSES